jgi:hypothetical protein
MRYPMIASALVGISLALLAGCREDSAYLHPMTTPTPVVRPHRPGAMAIASGSAQAVQPSMIHEEIEGSSALAVDEMLSDDPAVLSVVRTSHSYDVAFSPSPNDRTWVLIGAREGTTKLRLYRDHDEVDVLDVDVIAQVP